MFVLSSIACFRPLDGGTYAYLLGLYLGDGTLVVSSPRSVGLELYLDSRYPVIVAAACGAVQRAIPWCTVRTNCRGAGCIVIRARSDAWPALFPQHGPGRKHLRPIELAPWQSAITAAFPEELFRGLIHSDGSRCLNRFSTRLPSGRTRRYEYPRYFFTNYSSDIREIFCAHCELVGLRWTQSSHKNISIAHRDSVARLDAFVGPKQ